MRTFIGKHTSVKRVRSLFNKRMDVAHARSNDSTRRTFDECLKQSAPLIICECWESILYKKEKRALIIYYPCDGPERSTNKPVSDEESSVDEAPNEPDVPPHGHDAEWPQDGWSAH